MAVVLSVLALCVGFIALVLSWLALVHPGSVRRRLRRRGRVLEIPAEVEALRDEVEVLRADAAETMRHVAVVRYDAFGDMGGHLSWSMALLDDGGNGVVLTSIHGRSDARTYAKNVADWACDQQTSPEEDEALGYARSGARP
jgi:hypothetical protein